jgi:hypothetical protein
MIVSLLIAGGLLLALAGLMVSEGLLIAGWAIVGVGFIVMMLMDLQRTYGGSSAVSPPSRPFVLSKLRPRRRNRCRRRC